MANPNTAFGLRPSKSLGRSNVQVNEYAHPSGDGTALFIGDPVVTNAQGGSAAGALNGLPDFTPYVIASGTLTTVSPIRGAVVGVRPNYANLTLQYCPASTLLPILVADDPFQLFDIQITGAGTLVIDDISDTMGITSGSGSTTTGLSAYVATQSTGHADAADTLIVMRLSPIVNNLAGLNSVIQVKIALHELTSIIAPL